MAALSALVGKFLGMESAPIHFDRAGAKWSVMAAKLVDMAAEGPWGLTPAALSRFIWTTQAIQPRAVATAASFSAWASR